MECKLSQIEHIAFFITCELKKVGVLNEFDYLINKYASCSGADFIKEVCKNIHDTITTSEMTDMEKALMIAMTLVNVIYVPYYQTTDRTLQQKIHNSIMRKILTPLKMVATREFHNALAELGALDVYIEEFAEAHHAQNILTPVDRYIHNVRGIRNFIGYQAEKNYWMTTPEMARHYRDTMLSFDWSLTKHGFNFWENVLRLVAVSLWEHTYGKNALPPWEAATHERLNEIRMKIKATLHNL